MWLAIRLFGAEAIRLLVAHGPWSVNLAEFQQHLLLLRGMSKRPADEANAEAGEEAERQLAACAAPKAKAAAKAPPAGFTVDARGRLVGPPDLEEAERQQQQ